MRLLRPSSWPVALKLGVTLLAVSLIPLVVTAAYNLKQGLNRVEQSSLDGLEQQATHIAARLDQLLTDTARTGALVALEAEVVALLSARDTAPQATRASASHTLESLVRSRPELSSAFLLDSGGTCVASTQAADTGRGHASRDYFQAALQGQPFVSDTPPGATPRGPGLYLAHPVTGEQGGVVGVAVLELRGEAVSSLLDSLRVGEFGRNLLVDEHGTILSSTGILSLPQGMPALPPRPPWLIRRVAELLGVEPPPLLGVEALGQALKGSQAPGRLRIYGTPEHGLRSMGFSPLRSRPWTVGVEVEGKEFAAPMVGLAKRSLPSVLLVGGMAMVLALLLARGIVHPARELMRAAQAMARGEFEQARVPVHADDELGTLIRAFNTMAAGLKERERERDIFGRMVSPEVREKLLGGELRLGGETRRVAVLFSDIRGFSTLSERLDPQAVVALLNEYLTEMTEAVRPFQGYINNFIGDAIVIVFGAPLDQPDIEVRAARAALAMRERLKALNARRVARGDFPLDNGIGVGAGEAVAGQIGSYERLLYTVIGDVVNVAARLESLTKEHPEHPILMNRGLAEPLLRGVVGLRLEGLGPIAVKGRAEPVEVYALHPAEPAAEAREPAALGGTGA
jgi:adenylate cyclase